MAAMSPQAFSQSKSKTALTYMPDNSAWGMAMLSESIRIFPDDPLFIISSDLMQQIGDDITQKSRGQQKLMSQ